MIDRYLLRYFLAVADQGNFSRAAGQCHVSQPTLSVGIAKLERELGERLFDRSNRRVALTAAGARLIVHAQRIEAEFLQAERPAPLARARPLLRIGTLVSLPVDWVAEAVRRHCAQAGAERLEVVAGREADLLAKLERGRIDAALTILRGGHGPAEPIFTEGYALALPQDHPLAGRAALTAEEVADNVMIVRRHCEALGETSRHFTTRGVRPFIAARTGDDGRALAFVQAGLGITVMPDCFRTAGVARPRLIGFEARREIGMIAGPAAGVPLRATGAIGMIAATVAELHARQAAGFAGTPKQRGAPGADPGSEPAT